MRSMIAFASLTTPGGSPPPPPGRPDKPVLSFIPTSNTSADYTLNANTAGHFKAVTLKMHSNDAQGQFVTPDDFDDAWNITDPAIAIDKFEGDFPDHGGAASRSLGGLLPDTDYVLLAIIDTPDAQPSA